MGVKIIQLWLVFSKVCMGYILAISFKFLTILKFVHTITKGRCHRERSISKPWKARVCCSTVPQSKWTNKCVPLEMKIFFRYLVYPVWNAWFPCKIHSVPSLDGDEVLCFEICAILHGDTSKRGWQSNLFLLLLHVVICLSSSQK